MIKKKLSYFLILEVLIAFLLISMTILPFTSYPYKAFQKELSYLESMTIEPYFLISFIQALEKKDASESILDDMSVPFGNNDKLVIHRSASINITKNPKKTPYSLITIDVTISSKNTKKTRRKNFTMNSAGINNAI